MCYHIKQVSSIETLLKRFKMKKGVNAVLDFTKGEKIKGFIKKDSTEGFKVRVITNELPEDIQAFRWGLLPSDAKDMSIGGYNLNATIEQLDVWKDYAESANNRCLILVDGFYEHEWLDKQGARKQEHLVESADGKPLAFAGIWREAIAPNGEMVQSCAIVTTTARGIMRQIHNNGLRMPLILKPGHEREWLDADLNTFRAQLDEKVNVDLVATKIEKPRKNPEQLSMFD
jgi:putative SOS response-associated peptidase YedK